MLIKTSLLNAKLSLLLSMALSVALVGCSSTTPTPDQVQIPHNFEQAEEFEDYINNKLEGEEQKLVKQFLQAHPYGEAYAHAFMRAAERGKVIKLSDIIAEQRVANAQTEESMKQMRRALEVVYINHKPVGDGRYNYRIKFRNKMDKTIDESLGDLVFYDTKNKEVGRLTLPYREDLKAKETVYVQMVSEVFDGNKKADSLSAKSYGNNFEDKKFTSSQVKYEHQRVELKDRSELKQGHVDLLGLALR